MEDKENNNTTMSMQSSRLRKSQYRTLIDNIEEIEESEDLGHRTIQKVNDILKEANLLHDQCGSEERVQHADETLLDNILLTNATNFLVKCARAVDLQSSSYEPLEFCEKLKSQIKSVENGELDPLDFLNLLDSARKIIPETIKITFLHGAHDLGKPPPQPKVRKQREAPQKAEKKELIQVVNTQEDGENDDLVKFLYSILKDEYAKNGQKPLDYYKFVIDTSDFESTVNNIFYCSFLIRDGKASVILDKGIPMILPVDKKEMKAFRKNGGANTQIVTSIDMDYWKKFTTEGYVQKHRKQNNRKSQR